jgi:hypothetical protein
MCMAVPPSYKGDTQRARCPECDTRKVIPSDEFMKYSTRGHCSGPDTDDEACGQVDWADSPDTDL